MPYDGTNPTTDSKVVEIREGYEYDLNNWDPIRKEAKIDMQYVAGDPWTAEDRAARAGRPTVAPEEMSQYRNQVINALMANPRGGKFAPVGNGANDKTAEFYQNKWREVEYRSHATQAYNLAADNALQRSYGFVRVNYGYTSPRDANMEIGIEGFPNPDMVMPDCDSLRYDSADMKRCWVYRWVPQKDFKKEHPKAKVTNFGDFATTYKNFVSNDKVLLAEHWYIKTRPRRLMLVQPHGPAQSPRIVAPQPAALPPMQLFEDEILKRLQPGTFTVVRELRKVDYPEVKMCLTNGLEILSEHDWLGKYIPIVSCYGKVLFIEGDQGMERKILSMTRFMRDPWKSMCYAASKQLEVIGMTPLAPLMIPRNSMNAPELKAVQESPHQPKAYLTYDPFPPGLPAGAGPVPPPQRADYTQAEHLQALEMAKEGWRRAIQAAAGSNFLPTQAQRKNEKSGVALDKIDQVAAQGTYHFVYAYEGLIRQTAVIGEDLMDKIYDYRGETGVMMPDGKSATVVINDPDKDDSIDTKGDHVVTVSTAPSSDSEREAAKDFTDVLVSNLQMVQGVSGPKVAAAILAQSIRMRNLGPMGDQMADLIEPPEFKQNDGEPPDPRIIAMQAQIQQMTQVLQQAAQEKNAKVVEAQGKFVIEQMKQEAETERAHEKNITSVYVAELGAKMDRMALLIDSLLRIEEHRHEHRQISSDLKHDALERAKDRVHERVIADAAHQQALESADQAASHASDAAVQAAALQPPAGGA